MHSTSGGLILTSLQKYKSRYTNIEHMIEPANIWRTKILPLVASHKNGVVSSPLAIQPYVSLPLHILSVPLAKVGKTSMNAKISAILRQSKTELSFFGAEYIK